MHCPSHSQGVSHVRHYGSLPLRQHHRCSNEGVVGRLKGAEPSAAGSSRNVCKLIQLRLFFFLI